MNQEVELEVPSLGLHVEPVVPALYIIVRSDVSLVDTSVFWRPLSLDPRGANIIHQRMKLVIGHGSNLVERTNDVADWQVGQGEQHPYVVVYC